MGELVYLFKCLKILDIWLDGCRTVGKYYTYNIRIIIGINKNRQTEQIPSANDKTICVEWSSLECGINIEINRSLSDVD